MIGETHHYELFERRTVEHLASGGQQSRRIERDQDSRARIDHLRGQFLDGVERREIDHHRARHHRAVVGSDIGRDVGKKEADAVSLGDAALEQARGEPARLGVKLAVAEGAAEKLDQRRIGRLLRLARENVVKQHRPDGAVPRVRMAVVIAGRQGEALAYSHVITMHTHLPVRKSRVTSVRVLAKTGITCLGSWHEHSSNGRRGLHRRGDGRAPARARASGSSSWITSMTTTRSRSSATGSRGWHGSATHSLSTQSISATVKRLQAHFQAHNSTASSISARRPGCAIRSTTRWPMQPPT